MIEFCYKQKMHFALQSSVGGLLHLLQLGLQIGLTGCLSWDEKWHGAHSDEAFKRGLCTYVLFLVVSS